MVKYLIFVALWAASTSAAFARPADCDMTRRAFPAEKHMTHVSGTLVCDPALGNYDFEYLPGMAKPASVLQSNTTIQLQARFVWGGPAGTVSDDEQHTVVAYTQRGSTNNPSNAQGQMIFTHGAGAILSNRGLGLELWRRDDPANDGFENDFATAVVWTQDHNREAVDVASGNLIGMNLSPTPNTWGYITAAPNFTLRRNVAYWLRVKLYKDTAADRTTLYADVIEETPTNLLVVQSGLVIFPTSIYFPVADQALEATVARTPGTAAEPVVYFDAFDSGF